MPNGNPGHHPWEKYLQFKDDGCLWILDKDLIAEIKKRWTNATEYCIKLDDDGGGHGQVDAMCKCH